MTVTVGLGVARVVADASEVGRWVGVAVARAGVDACAVEDVCAVDDARALDDALAVPELWPDDGDGVRDAPADPVAVVTCGLGVKTDGTDEADDPPPEQAATATVSSAAAAPMAAVRPARGRTGRETA